MSNPQKSITISILKAYNWNEPQSNDRFEFGFYSFLTKALILQKVINTHILNNQLIINTSLKITYTPQQSQIILKMSRIGEDKSSKFLNEFVINLDLLQERKVQYLPFSKNDKILQVVSGPAHKEDAQQKKPVITLNKFDSFIQEKEVFLKNISVKSNSKLDLQQKQFKKTFTQKLYALLKQTKKLRQKMQSNKNRAFVRIGLNNNIITKDGFFQPEEQKLLIRSSSQNVLSIPKQGNTHTNNNKDINIIDKKANGVHSKRFKLDLKNLLLLDTDGPKNSIEEQEDEVLRSRQQNFAALKHHRNHLSSYIATQHHD